MKGGADLSPPVLPDANEDLQLLRDERSYLGAEECMTIVLQFLEQYYQLYDSENRDPLVSAYLDNAVFIIMSTCPLDQVSTSSFG
jgi:nuclear RNA export factor